MTALGQCSHETAGSLFLFSLSVFLAAVLSQQSGASDSPKRIRSDRYYLRLAHRLRLSLTPPRQSHFRVVAVLLLNDGTLIYGTNDEPSPSIGGAICAERAAFLSHRTQQCSQPVVAVYICTDSDRPVPPGTLCREYMYGHEATNPNTRIVMQSHDPASEPWSLTLEELYPYPSIYCGMEAKDQLAYGVAYEEEVENALSHLAVPGLFSDQLYRLVEAAHHASLRDDKDSLHPMRYGAAMAVEIQGSIEIIQATQIKALEYGSTQDAVCQLASHVLHNRAERILAVTQVDQFGIPHSPFAPARSFLLEHGLGDCPVVLTVRDVDGHVSVQAVPARELAPFAPHFR